eukprot:TRINITY_DN815_c0_g2_i1.p1 TRINITY_DN815_c0_g2~~TRINITY_DN815_c0_g2_i1.p1  ORF type:complete len:479 (+),score=193.96 TRINITY_DN815_c0_g2_i1:60-1496(+)
MGPILPRPVTTKVLERKSTPLFHVGLGCMNGYREKMEDAHSILPRDADKWGFFGVFDGHCGPLCSQYVSKKFEEVLGGQASMPLSDAEMERISLAIDKDFLDQGIEGGSTGTYMVVEKKGGTTYHLQVCNVGDSRIVLGRRKERLCVSLTEDHKPTNDEERQRIEKAGGHVAQNRVDGSLAVSRAFGDASYKTGVEHLGNKKTKVIAQPETVHQDAEEGDFVLLCCDGVFESDVFSNEGVIEFIFEKLDKKMDLASIAAAVCDEAMERGSKDNISAMIVQLGGQLDCKDALPEHEVVAGAYDAPDNSGFRTAYEQMAEQAGMSVAQCVELRFDQVTKTLSRRIKETKCGDKMCDFATLDLAELRRLGEMHGVTKETPAELIQGLTQAQAQQEDLDFRPVDVQNLNAELGKYNVPEEVAALPAGGDRTEWFANWVAERAESAGEGDDDLKTKALELQQKCGLPIDLLLRLMSTGNGDEK